MTDPTAGVPLSELTDYIRSKNAGPFWQTIDIFFLGRPEFERAVAAKVITAERIGSLYSVDPEHVKIFEMAGLDVIKVSFPRAVTAGSFADRDLHAGQQYVPLASLVVPSAA